MSFSQILVTVSTILTFAIASSETEDKKEEHVTKFGIFREDCFDTFLMNFDFSKTDLIFPCIEYSALKGVSFAIIAGSFVFKIPQVMKIVKSQSVEGISAMSYYTENMTFINTSSYSMQLGLSFMVYGESIVILI